MLLRLHILILPFLLQNFIEQSAAAEPPPPLPTFREAPAFRNGRGCPKTTWTPGDARAHDPAIIHIAMTLDTAYLRGSVAGVLSVLQHASCPENIVFHFVASCRRRELRRTLLSTFPYLRGRLHLHPFDSGAVRGMISSSVRAALDQPLNYARIYLAELLPAAVRRVLYLDSDLIVVDDAAALWAIDLRGRVLGAPEYCHVNLTAYFTAAFWSDPALPAAAWGGSGTGGESKGGGRERKRRRREPCYFNTGVMVIDLERWREGGHTRRVERWMRLQKRRRIYELGSLPPFLLAFAGEVEGVEHRWNQHGLGGDNREGGCRDLHPGPVSLLHWSGKGKPWLRLDTRRPCPLDRLWAPYDLFRHAPLSADE